MLLLLLPFATRAAETSCSATDAICSSAATTGSSLIQSQTQLHRYLPTEIRGKYINVNGVRFSRKGAESATLGRICHLGLLGFPPSVEFIKPGPDAWMKDNAVHRLTANITSEQTFELGISASVKLVDTEVKGEFGMNNSHSAGMTIQKLEFNNRDKLLDWMNKPKNAEWVARYRALNMPRVVLMIWLLVNQDVAEIGSQCLGGSLSVKYTGMGGAISAKGCGHSTWTFNAGAVVAYRLGKVVFDRKGNAIRIEEDTGTR